MAKRWRISGWRNAWKYGKSYEAGSEMQRQMEEQQKELETKDLLQLQEAVQ